MKNKKKKTQKKTPKTKLRGTQIAFYVFAVVLLLLSSVFGVGCLFLDFMLQGAVVLVADIVLALFLIELVRMDRKANGKKTATSIGRVITDIKGVSVKWADGTRDFATVELCETGMAVHGEKVDRVDPWVAVGGYRVVNDRQFAVLYAADASCVITCNSDLKCAAALTVLAEHVKEVFVDE